MLNRRFEVKGILKGPSVENGSNRQQSSHAKLGLNTRVFNRTHTIAAISIKTARRNC
jgi:hypothetical protein